MLNRPRHVLLFSLFAMSPAFAAAIDPGVYTAEKSRGTLEIKRDKSGKTLFSIESVGGNAHTCSLEGEIRNGRATLESEDPKAPCVVTFTPFKHGIDVQGGPVMACQYYCGVRASFEGLYSQAAPACRPDGVEKMRAAARKAYDRKAYDEARNLLGAALKDCAFFLGWITEGWVRNDLAITQHKLKDLAGCRETLKPLAEDAAMTDAQVRESYPPTDADTYLPVIRATRVNLKLCAAAKS